MTLRAATVAQAHPGVDPPSFRGGGGGGGGGHGFSGGGGGGNNGGGGGGGLTAGGGGGAGNGGGGGTSYAIGPASVAAVESHPGRTGGDHLRPGDRQLPGRRATADHATAHDAAPAGGRTGTGGTGDRGRGGPDVHGVAHRRRADLSKEGSPEDSPACPTPSSSSSTADPDALGEIEATLATATAGTTGSSAAIAGEALARLEELAAADEDVALVLAGAVARRG